MQEEYYHCQHHRKPLHQHGRRHPKTFLRQTEHPWSILRGKEAWEKDDRGKRPILVQFSDLKSKVSVMKKRGSLKGTNIYINDDLTPLQKQNQKILLDKMRKARGGKTSYITCVPTHDCNNEFVL